ncbi:unnamed protein product, partial [Mesorhabditis spiculigera]
MRGRLLENPEMDVQTDGMAFAFGTARKESDAEPYMDADGQKLKLPKGIYHYSSHDTGMDGQWRLPETGQWWRGGAAVRDNYRNIDGVYLRNPFAADPINVQVVTERRWEHGLEGTAADQTPEAALRKAQHICRTEDEAKCERALMEYYELQTETVAQGSAPLHEKLVQLGDIASSTKVRSKTGHGIGLLMELPGQEAPLYVGAALDKKNDRNLRMLFQPPRR